MSDQLTTPGVKLDPSLSDIEAEVSWMVANRPPEVVLSFEGLHEPEGLWAALTAIGWVVPAMPPRPANAIEWTPDPVAGTDFTVLPWRVSEHRLEEGQWTVNEELVGERTLDALLDYEATIIGSSDQIDEHARSYEQKKAERARVTSNPIQVQAPVPEVQPAPIADTAAVTPAPVADAAAVTPAPVAGIAAPVPQTTAPETDAAAKKARSFGLGPVPNPAARFQAIADGAGNELAAAATKKDSTEPGSLTGTSSGSRYILLLDYPAEHDPLPSAGTWMGVTGRTKIETLWSEVSIPQDVPIPGHEGMAVQVANGAGAWYADTDQPLGEVAGSRMTCVRVFLPDLSVNDAQVRRMSKLLGEGMESYQLRSLIGGEAVAVIVSAKVQASSFEMLKTNFALRMPNAIIRTAA